MFVRDVRSIPTRCLQAVLAIMATVVMTLVAAGLPASAQPLATTSFGATQLASPSLPAGDGAVSGTVSASGSTLAGVCVYALEVLGTPGALTATGTIYSARTGADGTYSVDVSPGTYAVLFDPTCTNTQTSQYAFQFYEGEADFGTASTFVVTAGSVVPGVDGDLANGATISGVVSSGGEAVGGVCVSALANDGYEINSTVSAADGSYSISNLPADSYEVYFDPTCAGTQTSPYATQFYSGQLDASVANDTVVAAGENDANDNDINANLLAGATISGTVTAPGAANDANICVSAMDANGDVEGTAVTDVDGNYAISSLPAITSLPGEPYTLYFDPTCGGVQQSDFAPKQDLAETALVAGQDIDVDASLTLTATVTAMSISPTSLPSATAGSPYSVSLNVSGGTGPYTWTSGGLPEGLVMDGSTGQISGTPTTSGTFTLTAAANDLLVPPLAAGESYTLSIAGPPSSTTMPGPPALGGLGGGGVPVALPTTTTTTPGPTTSTTTTTPPRHSALPPGTPVGTYAASVNATVKAGTITHLAYHLHVASGAVTVPAGALPVGTTVSIFPVKDPAALANKMPPSQSYLISFAVSWVAPNGTSPTAKPPVTLTITDPAIKVGDAIYELTSKGLKAVGVATKDGVASVSFANDTDLVVASVPQFGTAPSLAGVKNGNVQVKLVCSLASKCSGTGALRTMDKGSSHALVLAKGTFALGAGQTMTVSFAATPGGRQFLAANRGRPFTGSLAVALTGGKSEIYRVTAP
jgi:Putative Ig domain